LGKELSTTLGDSIIVRELTEDEAPFISYRTTQQNLIETELSQDTQSTRSLNVVSSDDMTVVDTSINVDSIDDMTVDDTVIEVGVSD
jgi:hypothetical protein